MHSRMSHYRIQAAKSSPNLPYSLLPMSLLAPLLSTSWSTHYLWSLSQPGVPYVPLINRLASDSITYWWIREMGGGASDRHGAGASYIISEVSPALMSHTCSQCCCLHHLHLPPTSTSRTPQAGSQTSYNPRLDCLGFNSGKSLAVQLPKFWLKSTLPSPPASLDVSPPPRITRTYVDPAVIELDVPLHQSQPNIVVPEPSHSPQSPSAPQHHFHPGQPHRHRERCSTASLSAPFRHPPASLNCPVSFAPWLTSPPSSSTSHSIGISMNLSFQSPPTSLDLPPLPCIIRTPVKVAIAKVDVPLHRYQHESFLLKCFSKL
ncbi:hypothetical protein C8F01DRAFT_1142387 [Mycena amicta]|nr:hypothetical protein C8F01DRAFT_1142387 [Mycena amicta]